MSPACCGIRSVRIIRVGDSRAGVTGVDQLLKRVNLEGWSPEDEGLGKRLVEGLRATGNYVSPAAEAAYARSLLDLYRSYVDAARKLEFLGASEGSVKR